MINQSQIDFFDANGYLCVENLLNLEEVNYFRQIYEDFLSGKIDTKHHRSDLSGETANTQQEKIVQIMRPSLLFEPLKNSVIHTQSLAIAKKLQGNDLEMDFDMMIDKPSYSNAPTPWHQDEAYWLDMPDKRAVSCWLALDDVVKENGCMWFVPKSHKKEIRKHTQIGKKGALKCEANEEEAVAIEMKAGSCTFHHGRTLHYARGNSTEMRRRAFIVNFRAKDMIQLEREQGFDHLGEREVR